MSYTLHFDLSTDFPPQYVLSDHYFRQICGKFQLYSSCCPSLYLSIRTRVGGLGRYFHKRFVVCLIYDKPSNMHLWLL
ncbi:hypothetical protein ERO13_D12G163933v2 [Gossypium hirsutum]|nr:hypothetical protein ERO13_D12G163933v2 [Gossypium hirsutum]